MKNLIVANWKMNPTGIKEALRIAKASDKEGVVLCPPFVFLDQIKKNIKKAELGAQNSFWDNEGSFTGEISPLMLKKIGCRYVIIGHSERRGVFQETDTSVNKKLKAALKEKLKPILCIGEEKRGNKKEIQKILKNQIMAAFRGIKKSSVIVAYEPVWAIGTGKSSDLKNAQEARIFIEKILKERSSIKKPCILYGGSVDDKNSSDYLEKALFDGLLIGGASLNSEKFKKIIKNCHLV